MSDSATSARMLLSHNFAVSVDRLPWLDREAFMQVFAESWRERSQLSCRLLDHPHWVVEISFLPEHLSPAELGDLCARTLAEKRRSQIDGKLPDILVLGGIKNTPVTTSNPNGLQTGDWGVDVVETESAAAFLAEINWEGMTAARPPEDIFKVELKD
ncbi:MAG: DUF2656 family protein [Cyanobacteria bacterium J06642_2]